MREILRAVFDKKPASGGEMGALPPLGTTHGLKPVPLPSKGGKDEL